MNRLLLEAETLDTDDRAIVRGRFAIHIREVLKAAIGATIRIGRINGPRGVGTVTRIGQDSVEIQCRWEADVAPPPRISLVLALPRPKVLKRLWAPLASLGLRRLVLIGAARVERNYFDTHWLNETAYRPLLLEGLAQAGTTRLPTVTLHRRFKPWLEDELALQFSDETRLLADPAAPGRLGRQPLPRNRAVVLAVGPEGGWIPYERDRMLAHGFQPVSLGQATLRTDIACIALLAVLNERLATVNA